MKRVAKIEERSPFRRRISRSNAHILKQICVQMALVIVGVFIVVPFIYVVSASLKSTGQWILYPTRLIPPHPTIENYINVFRSIPVFAYAKNTLIIVVLSGMGSIISCALVSYPLARLKFPGRELVFLAILATLMLPPQVLLIPQYLIFHNFGWVNTLLPLIVPSWFGLSAFYVFLLRQFFRTIPKELDEATLLDGGGRLRIFWHIILPLSKPVLITILIFHVVGTYNDFFAPIIYLHSKDKFTLAIGMAIIEASLPYGIPTVPISMAAAIIFALPLIVFFLLLQKHFTQGIQLTAGLKA